MANRNKGRRGRSRKQRPRPSASTAGASTQTVPRDAEAGGKAGSSAPPRRRRASERNAAAPDRIEASFRVPMGVGERPQAPWHPLPLSELLILVGAIGTVIGLSRGVSNGGPPLIAGLAAVIIGTLEVTIREHLSGYRSHTIMLALIPALVFHTVALLVLSAFLTPVPAALKVAPLVIDVAIFAFVFKLLRARFQDARRERVFAGGRRR